MGKQGGVLEDLNIDHTVWGGLMDVVVCNREETGIICKDRNIAGYYVTSIVSEAGAAGITD